MRAAVYTSFHPDPAAPGVVTVRDVPEPRLMPGSVLIEVRAAGVNPADWQLVTGEMADVIETVFPAVPGQDVAGVVVAVGVDTPEFTVGDEVMAFVRHQVIHDGTFAERVAVPAPWVARKPVCLTWEQAGALPVAGVTALRTLDALGVRAADTLLVHAAAGGVGAVAVQLAVARGARVIGTASPRNHEYLRGLGIEPVAYDSATSGGAGSAGGWAAAVRDLAPAGVTAVADLVGGQLQSTLSVLAPGGRHASIADPEVARHGGVEVWARPDGREVTRLGELAAAGLLTVHVAQTFGLDEVPDAFAASRTGHVRGKLVITPRPA